MKDVSNTFLDPSPGRLTVEAHYGAFFRNNQTVQEADRGGLFLLCKGYLYRSTLSRRLIASRFCVLGLYFGSQAMAVFAVGTRGLFVGPTRVPKLGEK